MKRSVWIILDILIVISGILVAGLGSWWFLEQNLPPVAEKEAAEPEIMAEKIGNEAFAEKWIGATSAAFDHGKISASDVKEQLRIQREEERKAALAALRVRRDVAAYIDLQPVVNQWLASYRFGEASIEIFGVDYGVVVASYRPNARMSPRSLYKLFYVYDGYAQIDAGVDDANQAYLGSMSLGYCLDIMVRQSNNSCAEAMLDDSARQKRVGQLIADLGLTSTSPNGLITSAHDISLLLQYYYRHPEWSASSWWKFRDSALNQGYAFRKGLPAGFSTATVYDKVGYGSGYSGNEAYAYNDAAMVEFPLVGGMTRRYIIVVMTSNPSSYTILTRLGEMLESAILYVN